MKEKKLEWYGRKDIISSERPKLVTGTLENGDWESITVTTKQYRHFVWDDYAGDWCNPDEPLSNGVKTERDFQIWYDNMYSDITVKGGTVTFHRTE